MATLMLAVLLAGPVFPAYPLPGFIANGPAPMFATAEDAALCEDALWVNAKGLPAKAKDQAKYQAARAVCDKALESLEPGVQVIVEGSFTLSSPHLGLAAFRIQGLIGRSAEGIPGYVGVSDFWVPANRVRLRSLTATTEAEQTALWKRLTGRH
jgi:hypothetical protein